MPEETASPQPAESVAVKPKATPLPMKQMTALAIVLLTEPLCSTMLFPFVGLLVAHIQHIPPEESGYTSGILIGLFMLGQVVSGKLWGFVSDQYGRKYPLMCGLFAGAWMTLLFGLSKSIVLCCILRFLHGFFNGNVLIAKVIIADVTDKTNEAKGFAVMNITWGVGTLFGPAIGGFLYDPAHNPKLRWAHISEDGFLANYPAFLPSLVIFFYTIGALVYCIFYLEETNPHGKPIWSMPGLRQLHRFFTKTSNDAGQVTITNTTDLTTTSVEVGPMTVPSALPSKPKAKKMTYMEAMRIAPIRNLTIFYMLLATSDMIYSEILPLWCIASVEVGGMGLFSDEVGMLVLSYSVPCILANLQFPRMCKTLGSYILFWRISITIYTVSMELVPFGSSFHSSSVGFFYVLFFGVIRQVGSSWSYSLINMLPSKSAPPGCVGAIYGITQSCASFVRCVVPFIAAPLFAWSIDAQRSFPFNFWLLFLLSAVPTLITIYMSFRVHISPRETDENKIQDATVPSPPTVQDDVSEDVSTSGDGEGLEMEEFRSLASSFCATSVHGGYIDVEGAEAKNEARRQRALAKHIILEESLSHQQREDERVRIDVDAMV